MYRAPATLTTSRPPSMRALTGTAEFAASVSNESIGRGVSRPSRMMKLSELGVAPSAMLSAERERSKPIVGSTIIVLVSERGAGGSGVPNGVLGAVMRYRTRVPIENQYNGAVTASPFSVLMICALNAVGETL